MNRHYYISNDLDELEAVEHELETEGINSEQMHVLSNRDADVEKHHLHEVTSFMKQDAVHSGSIGALIGTMLALLLLAVVYTLEWHRSAAGWLPFAFLALVIIGFATWEGGLLGIQRPNAHFRRFKRLLRRGRHIFFVDVEPEQENTLDSVIHRHPSLRVAGSGEAMPHWLLGWLHRWHQFKRTI